MEYPSYTQSNITLEEEATPYFDQFMEQFPHMEVETQKFTRSILMLKKYKKKEFLAKAGDVQTAIPYICQGLVRRYYINEKGNTITTSFTSEQGYATDYPSFLNQRPTKYYLECLEPTIVVEMPYEKLQEAYRNFKDSEMYGRLIAEMVLTREIDRVESFLFENAEQRYLNFLETHKHILNRISLSHLASYLGIERQSLSRIRSNLAKK